VNLAEDPTIDLGFTFWFSVLDSKSPTDTLRFDTVGSNEAIFLPRSNRV
jgi:hypothetical protein